MNPTIDKKIVDKTLKKDYSSARAEWESVFREDLETFLQTEIIEAAIVQKRFELPKNDGIQYFAFTDPSGSRADSFTLAIAHKEKESEKIILDRLEEKKPPFQPKSVVKEFSEIIKSYGTNLVTGDKYAGEWVSSAFREEDVIYEASKLDKSGIYLEFEPLLAQGQVELLDNKKLFNQLRGLERRTRSGGRDRIDHYPGGHDDLANATAGACVLVSGEGDYARDIWILEGEEPPDMKPWEAEMIRARQEEPEKYEDPPEIKKIHTEKNIQKYIDLIKEGKKVPEISEIMGIPLDTMRKMDNP